MNRLQLTAMLWLSVLACCTAQDPRIFNQVVASTGNYGVQQGLSYTYTVGEVVIATLSSTERTVTQGFHQPEHTSIVTVSDPDFSDWGIEVFPNPATDFLAVRFSADKGQRLAVNVFDVVGRAMLLNQPLTEPDGSLIDCRIWQPGVYFVQLLDPSSKATTTVRIVRL